jgi:ribosomal protein S5
MGVDHRRLDTPVAQQLLHCTDIVAGLKEVGSATIGTAEPSNLVDAGHEAIRKDVQEKSADKLLA